jgi:hypothetical protein
MRNGPQNTRSEIERLNHLIDFQTQFFCGNWMVTHSISESFQFLCVQFLNFHCTQQQQYRTLIKGADHENLFDKQWPFEHWNSLVVFKWSICVLKSNGLDIEWSFNFLPSYFLSGFRMTNKLYHNEINSLDHFNKWIFFFFETV